MLKIHTALTLMRFVGHLCDHHRHPLQIFEVVAGHLFVASETLCLK